MLLLIQNKERFKPCYKWNTFNTTINKRLGLLKHSFKPCYKWNTFNTDVFGPKKNIVDEF